MGFKLQSTTNLTAGNWVTVPGTQTINDGQFEITNSMSGVISFCRLKYNETPPRYNLTG